VRAAPRSGPGPFPEVGDLHPWGACGCREQPCGRPFDVTSGYPARSTGAHRLPRPRCPDPRSEAGGRAHDPPLGCRSSRDRRVALRRPLHALPLDADRGHPAAGGPSLGVGLDLGAWGGCAT
jgi:hypothetical protein